MLNGPHCYDSAQWLQNKDCYSPLTQSWALQTPRHIVLSCLLYFSWQKWGSSEGLIKLVMSTKPADFCRSCSFLRQKHPPGTRTNPQARWRLFLFPHGSLQTYLCCVFGLSSPHTQKKLHFSCFELMKVRRWVWEFSSEKICLWFIQTRRPAKWICLPTTTGT